AADDPCLQLWALDIEVGGSTERELVDPRNLLADDENLSPEERARRERSRESATGIVSYATDREVGTVAFAISGRLFTTTVADGATRELATPTPVIDPRPSPDGTLIAYVCSGELRVIGVDGSGDRAVAQPDGADTTYGLVDFIA